MEWIYSKKPKVVEGIIAIEEEGKMKLFNPTTGKKHVLNTTGKYIFQLCDGEKTVEDIWKLVVRDFNCSNIKKVKEDVCRFLYLLAKRGYIEFKE
ncbi:hypothetical protein ADU37_CDS22500 [Thermococcus sp. 2319x1]|uniref:PqqD family protein n=1 Tax=Thermococcus sp. 2319x1 TaxID=1674923 RepID=UPI00073ADE59|nr:PqqD family protein [Thermococcus sp. 2319x1]ALV63947.1 hypothetical protein ADU37_CDS22500 [Thermococcus sp. 2319x1]